VACAVLPAAAPSAVSARPGPPAIFLVPHQDDDVLMYGADLKNHVLSGRRTIAVLLTDGSSSRRCPDLHDDRASCSGARDEEFLEAMHLLGVRPVIPAARATDGELTTPSVLGVMRRYLARFPRASFRAPTPRDPHPDHAAIGQALRKLVRSTDKRFYIKPSLWPEYPDRGRWVRRRNINEALDAYAGFGHLAAPVGFDEQYGGARASRDPARYNRGGADAKYHH
jgi:LmbE family N-acetylglucosaminyl deacetylase